MKIIVPLAALALSACAANPAPAPDYRNPPPPTQYSAIGTEPGWNLTINGDSIRLATQEGYAASDRVVSFTPNPQGDVYQGQRMTVKVEPVRCSDGMSDRIYPHRVTVQFDGKTYLGCGGQATNNTQY